MKFGSGALDVGIAAMVSWLRVCVAVVHWGQSEGAARPNS
jgi:hypothetical protein